MMTSDRKAKITAAYWLIGYISESKIPNFDALLHIASDQHQKINNNNVTMIIENHLDDVHFGMDKFVVQNNVYFYHLD